MANDNVARIKKEILELKNRGNLSTISDVFNMIYDSLNLLDECSEELDHLSSELIQKNKELDQAHSIINILETTDTSFY